MIVIYLPPVEEEPVRFYDYTKVEQKLFHELMPKIKQYDLDDKLIPHIK
jgi:hypothetical protein